MNANPLAGHEMWRLVESEFWRDGGSYSAVLTDGATTIGLWLQVNRWNHPSERCYEALYFSDGPDPTQMQQLIPTIELRPWLDRLAYDTDTTSASDHSRERFAQLVSFLEELVNKRPLTAV